MIGKALVIFALTAVAVQSFVPYENEVLQVDNVGKSIIEELEELVAKAFKSAVEKLEQLAKDFVNKAKEIAAAAIEALKKQITDLLNQVEKLKEEAKALGIDITECLKDNEDALKNLPEKYGERIRNCSHDIIEEGNAVIEKANATIVNATKIVKELSDAFAACGSGFASLPCKANVTYEIGKAIVVVPVQIVKIVSEAVPEIAGLYPDLQKCTTTESKAFIQEGEQIIQNITKCVEDKVKPHNVTTAAPEIY